MTGTTNYYKILDLEDRYGHEISQSELRQAYKQALLFYHPDKQVKNAAHGGKPTEPVPTIDDISEAFKTLADPELRAHYDRERNNSGFDAPQTMSTRYTGVETVDLEELEFDERNGAWNRPCRCGSQPAFVVTEPELEKNLDCGEMITGCKGCSLWLKVLFSVAE